MLGDLTEDEIERVQTLLEQNLEFVQEIQALKVSLNLVPTALPQVNPPLSLKDKINAAYAEELAQQELEHSSVSRSRFPGVKWIAVVATFSTLILGINNISLRNKLRLALKNQTTTSASEQVVSVLQNSKSRLISLQSQGNSEATGTFLFTPGRWEKEVFVALENLPPLPPGKVYRMWVAIKNGDQFFCGEFSTGIEGSVFVRLTPPGKWPKGLNGTNVFVTVDDSATAPEPSKQQVLFGEINQI